jgi:signal peptidase
MRRADHASSALRVVRRCVTTLLSIVAGLAIGIALATAAPYVFGERSFTVLSGSMEPTIHTGDVVVVRPIKPVEARVGDVVTFQDPNDSRRLITHRLRKARVRDGVAQMVTKGDANNTPERWSVPADGRIGQVRYRIPYLGHALAAAHGRGAIFLLILVPALLLGVYELVRLWRPERLEADPPMPINNCVE